VIHTFANITNAINKHQSEFRTPDYLCVALSSIVVISVLLVCAGHVVAICHANT